MEQRTEIGMNRTGIHMSPKDTKRMLEANEQAGIPKGDESVVTEMRSDYISDAEPIGTVPMPGTAKGAAKTGAKKLTGKNPEVFIDKLGARLAFERSGTRLYEALLTKCEAVSDGTEALPAGVTIEKLRHIHDEEAAHFEMLAECLEALGADPTAQTPSADVSGVESFGIMQVLNDPRTTVPQCLDAILVAELADNAAWELLIKLAEEMKQTDMVGRFRTALAQENEHLATVKSWVEGSVLQKST